MKNRKAPLVLLALFTLLLALSLPRGGALARAQAERFRATPTPAREGADFVPVSPEEAPPLPDLVVTSIRVIPDPPLVGRPVTFEVTIANIGDAPVPVGNNFFVDLYVNPAIPPRACSEGDFFWGVQADDVGMGSFTVSASFDPETTPWLSDFLDVGLVPISAQVDNATDAANNRCGFVVESREDNNILTTAVDVTTRYAFNQTTPSDFQSGFTSALDLTHPLGVLQNGTGWFEEPRFPPPEDPNWPVNPAAPWDSSTFYNPDLHIEVDNFPDNFPPDQIQFWNPPDQEHVDIEVGQTPDVLYAAWEDARNGDLNNRRIYFSYTTDRGRTWLAPIPITNEPGGGQSQPRSGIFNQLRPDLVIDRETGNLFVFWEDNRAGNYDIYFARSFDLGFTWEEPTVNSLPVNPVNDFEIDPDADQRNVSADVFYNEGTGESELFVVWEDYRNGNADLFFEWSRDSGTTWLKTEDNDPTTIDSNIHIQPNPTTNAGIFDQRKPQLALERHRSDGVVNYCIEYAPPVLITDNNGTEVNSFHPYPYNPLPAVYVTWEDERDIVDGDPNSIYYTRGEFNYEFTPPPGFSPRRTPGDPLLVEDCNNGGPLPPQPRDNLPPYRFEDDHVKVNSEDIQGNQQEPALVFDDSGFITSQFQQSYDDPVRQRLFTYICEMRFPVKEVVVSWQDDRLGDFDIWAANVLDDVYPVPTYSIIDDPSDEEFPSEPPPGFTTLQACLGDQQSWFDGTNGIGMNNLVPLYTVPDEIHPYRNVNIFSPQPPEFYDLALPEPDLEISDGLTFTAKPLCRAPNEPPIYTRDDTLQFSPETEVLPTPPQLVNTVKGDARSELEVTLTWTIWADTLALDNTNQDLFLRPVVRRDLSRALTIENPDDTVIPLQTVQDNVKNQIALRQRNLFEDFEPPTAQQANPAITFNLFDNGEFALYAGWDDNRNANPVLGFEGNKDVFAARLQLDDTLYGELRPLRTGSFVSSVYDGDGDELTWYDIEWWGDISADGVLTLQTRFGLDPNNPEPPIQNIAANGWTQWTGTGGVGGFYSAPGQHIIGPDGARFPRSYYIQYRVNFNPASGGQQGIICLSQIDLNFERPERLSFIPLVAGGPPVPGGGGQTGTVSGSVVDAATGGGLVNASVCDAGTNSCTTTDGTGAFSLAGVPAGSRSFSITATGYVPLNDTVNVVAGQNTAVTFALTQPLNAGEIRIVLTWNQTPEDLDSHLWLPPATPYHIYFASGGSCGAFPWACLDRDDIDSFGPETITISQREPGRYRYAVHRFSGAGTLEGSGARVQVYDANGLRAEFTVPAGQGDWWTVFEIDGASGTITPVNTIGPGTPAPYLGLLPTSDTKFDAR